MFEKLKDIFYDLNDLLVTLIIILVIVLAIAYVFTNAFDLDLNRASVFDFFTTNEPVTDEGNSPSETANDLPATTEPPTGEPASPIVNVDPESSTPTTPTQTATEPTPQSVVLTMAEGMSLAEFAQMMQQNGVISDYQSFVNLVVAQGLDTQVQALTYEFPLDITDAEAVRIMFP